MNRRQSIPPARVQQLAGAADCKCQHSTGDDAFTMPRWVLAAGVGLAALLLLRNR